MTLYTTQTCPKCRVIKIKLEQAGIEYNISQDEDKMRKLGIQQVPILEKDGELLDFSDILDYIAEVEG